jgi:hypothetical protein
MSSLGVNPIRWPELLEERSSNLLCMFVHVDIHDTTASGLLLRRLYSTTDEIVYVRMGTFRDFHGTFSSTMSARLGYPAGHSMAEDIDVDHAGLEDSIHTVTVL